MSVFSSKSLKKNINHKLHILLENKDLKTAEEFINYDTKKLKGKELKGFISLKLKYYFLTNDILNIESIYYQKEQLMKRDILGYCHYFYKIDKNKSITSFLFLISNHKLTNDNIDFIIENDMIDYLKLLDGYYYRTNYSNNLKSTKYLKSYPLSNILVKKTLKKISDNIDNKNISSFCNKLNEIPDEKLVIDGGNILFYFEGEVSVSGYMLLSNIINHLKEKNFIPVLVIHNRHLKQNNSKQKLNYINKIKKDCEYIFETPYHKNDDYYILYSFLSLSCKVLSNDNYKDHIYNFRSNLKDDEMNLLGKYIEDLLIKYDFDKKLSLGSLEIISNCIQVFEDKIYIPTADNGFHKILF